MVASPLRFCERLPMIWLIFPMAANCSACFTSFSPSRLPMPAPGCLLEGCASVPCPGEFSACCDSLLRSGSCSSPPACPFAFSPFCCCLFAFCWPFCLPFCDEFCCWGCWPPALLDCCFMLDSRFCRASRILLIRLELEELFDSCPLDCWFCASLELLGRSGFSWSEARSWPSPC